MSSVKANFQKQHHCQGKRQNSSMTIAQDKCHDTSMTLVVIRRVPASPLLVPALTSARHVPTLAAPASAESNAHNDLDSRQLVASGQLCDTSQTSTQSGRHAHIPEPRPAPPHEAAGKCHRSGHPSWANDLAASSGPASSGSISSVSGICSSSSSDRSCEGLHSSHLPTIAHHRWQVQVIFFRLIRS